MMETQRNVDDVHALGEAHRRHTRRRQPRFAILANSSPNQVSCQGRR